MQRRKKITNERTANFLELLLSCGTCLARQGEHSCENARRERLERLRRLVHRHCRDDMGDGFVDNYLVVLHELRPDVGSKGMQIRNERYEMLPKHN